MHSPLDPQAALRAAIAAQPVLMGLPADERTRLTLAMRRVAAVPADATLSLPTGGLHLWVGVHPLAVHQRGVRFDADDDDAQPAAMDDAGLPDVAEVAAAEDIEEAPIIAAGALLPAHDAAPHLHLKAHGGPGEVWGLSAAGLEAWQRVAGWSERRRAAFGRQVAMAAASELSADLRQSARRDRQALIGAMAAPDLGTAPTLDRLWVVVRGEARLDTPDGAVEHLRMGDLVGISALDGEPDPLTGRLALGPGCEALCLTPRAARRVRRASPWFDRLVIDRAAIERDRPALLAALGRSPLFAGARPDQLAALLQGARCLSWRVGLASPALVSRTGGFAVIRTGQLMRVRARDAVGRRDATQDLLEVADPDDCAFFAESASRAEEGAWRARQPSQVVYVSRGRAERVLGARSGLAQRLQGARRHRRALAAATDWLADVVLFEALAPVPEAEVQRLAAAVAWRVAHDFGESVAVLHLEPGKGRRGSAWRDVPDGEEVTGTASAACVRWRAVPVGDDPTAALRVALAEVDARWPAGARPPSRVWVLAARGVPTAALRADCDRTLLIDPDGRALLPAAPPGLPMVFARFRPAGAPLPNADRPNTVRLPGALGALDARAQAPALAALARAITGRRLGVALGGGGAWGYVHLAMLTHLSRREVPVDLLSGASFGAVVGASYAAGGLDGLNRLLAKQRALSAAVAAGVLSGGVLQRFFDGLFTGPDGRPLDLRETPVAFVPACTDLVTASQTPLLVGSLGHGVRASGSMPPVFAATPRGTSILLDGAFSANVPAVICANEGMDLVVASEVIPAFKAPPGRDPGGVREVMMGLNPLRRLRDLVLGVGTLVETASETSAMVARVVFAELARPQVLPLALADAEGVIEAAVSDPAFWNTLRRVEALWTQLAEPRRR